MPTGIPEAGALPPSITRHVEAEARVRNRPENTRPVSDGLRSRVTQMGPNDLDRASRREAERDLEAVRRHAAAEPARSVAAATRNLSREAAGALS
ncbi:hypothetical protein FJZ36_18320 [Candidatus Poribacteria bacterium]|nr:hypothetical protein [Candidatus Poribacteria bacterium]